MWLIVGACVVAFWILLSCLPKKVPPTLHLETLIKQDLTSDEYMEAYDIIYKLETAEREIDVYRLLVNAFRTTDDENIRERLVKLGKPLAKWCRANEGRVLGGKLIVKPLIKFL